MSFFNKKEEVVEIILTSYGKYKLSRGEWKPTYYAFFDEDIIYDNRYASNPEISGSAEARIQEETPSLRAQTSHSDLPKQIRKLTRASKASTNPDLDRSRTAASRDRYATALRASSNRAPYILPLGNSSIVSEKMMYAPAWEIKALKNEFTASMSHVSSSYEVITQIPQLDVDIDYTTKIYKTPFSLQSGAGDDAGKVSYAETTATEMTSDGSEENQRLPWTATPREQYLNTYFPDDTMLLVDDNYLILEVNEINAAKAIDPFYVEVWEVEEDSTLQPKDRTGQTLTRMSFVKYGEEIVNDILIDPSEIPSYNLALLDDTYVEYFMDIQVDEEIDDSAVCKYIATDDKIRMQWTRVLDCYDAVEDPGSVLYNTDDIDLLGSLCEECE